MGRSKVSALSTLVMSLIWATSSLAATRGAAFLPLAVAGDRMWLEVEAIARNWGAMVSARPSFRLAPSAWMTLATPAIWAAACAAAPAFSPATSTCTSPPQARAAVTVLSVALLMEALSCSAITRDVMSLSSLDHFGFVLELGHQRGNVRHLDTGAALGGLGHLERLQARGDIDAQLFR